MIGILRIKDENGEWQEIQAIKGTPGQDGYTPIKGVDYFDGKDGVDGRDYVLTQADKQEIAGMVDLGDVKLDDYATIQYVDEAILAIPKPDLSDYATIDQVNEAILAIPKPDLSPYQTAEQVETAINNALSSIGVAEEGEY